MKGSPQPLCIVLGRHVIELVGYADGSFGILRDGCLIGVWEAEEGEACLETLRRLEHLQDHFPDGQHCELAVMRPRRLRGLASS